MKQESTIGIQEHLLRLPAERVKLLKAGFNGKEIEQLFLVLNGYKAPDVRRRFSHSIMREIAELLEGPERWLAEFNPGGQISKEDRPYYLFLADVTQGIIVHEVCCKEGHTNMRIELSLGEIKFVQTAPRLYECYFAGSNDLGGQILPVPNLKAYQTAWKKIYQESKRLGLPVYTEVNIGCKYEQIFDIIRLLVEKHCPGVIWGNPTDDRDLWRCGAGNYHA